MCTAPTEGGSKAEREKKKRERGRWSEKWKRRKSERGGQCGAREVTGFVCGAPRLVAYYG